MTGGLGRADGDEPDPPDGTLDPEIGERLGRRELQDRAVRGVTWTMVNTVVSLPIAFLVNLVVARVLGVVDYGRLAFLTVVMEVAAGIVMLGVNPALVQFGAKAHAAGRRAEVADLLSKVQGFRLLVAAPILTVVVVVVVSDVGPWFKLIAVVFGVVLPAALDGAPACLGIENKTAAGAKVVLVSNVLTQLAVLGTVLVVAQADVVWAVRLIMVSVTVLLCLIPISASYRRAVLRPRFPRGFPQGFWRFALPTGLAALISTLVVSRTEVLALTWLSDPVSVGLFALAFGLAGHMYAPAQAIIGPLVPAISGLREVDAPSVAKAFGRALRGSSTVVALLSGIALPVVAVLTPTLYGSSYTGIEPVVLAIGVANGFLVVGAPVSAFVHGPPLGLPGPRREPDRPPRRRRPRARPHPGVGGVGRGRRQHRRRDHPDAHPPRLRADRSPPVLGDGRPRHRAGLHRGGRRVARLVCLDLRPVGLVGGRRGRGHRGGRRGRPAVGRSLGPDRGRPGGCGPRAARAGARPGRRDPAERQVARRGGRVTRSSTRSTAAAVSAQRNRSALTRPRADQPSRSTSTDSKAARSDSWSSGSK